MELPASKKKTRNEIKIFKFSESILKEPANEEERSEYLLVGRKRKMPREQKMFVVVVANRVTTEVDTAESRLIG